MTKLLNLLHEIKVIPSKVGQIAKDEKEIEQFLQDTNWKGGGLLTYLTPEMSYNELKNVLGADASVKDTLSYDESDNKVTSEWYIKYGNPPKIGRIYDYKNDFAPFAEPDRPYLWHVGGNNDFKTEFLDKVGLKYNNSWQDMFESFLDESLILEISEKVIKQKYEEYKKQNPNLDYEIVQYYVNRFDQIKNGLKDRVQRNDELVKTLLPKDLKTEEALKKLFYLDILRWKKFNDLERLIDGAFSKTQAKKKEDELVNSVETDADLIYNKDGIEIYRGDAEPKCIKYGKNAYYSWCISRPQGSMYGNYRFRQGESRMFYFVFDRNRPDTKRNDNFVDDYHAMVIHKYEDGSWALTKASNNGDDRYKTFQELVNSLPDDLKNALEKNENLFQYIQPSREEIELQALKGKALTAQQFAELSYEIKKQYVRQNAQNYNYLTSEIFNLLDNELKNEAINFDRKSTYDELKSNLGLVKRHADYRFTRYPNEPLPYKFISFLKPDLQKIYYDKFEEDYLTFDEIEEFFNKNILKDYIEKQISNFDFLPKEAVKYMTPDQKKIFDLYSKSFLDIEYQSAGGGSSVDRLAPSRYVKIHPINTKSYQKLSAQEKEELFNLTQQLSNNPKDREKHLAFTLGIPVTFEQNGKMYLVTPNSKEFNTKYSILDANGNVLKTDLKSVDFYKDNKKVPFDVNFGTNKGSETFYLKPGVDYDTVILNGDISQPFTVTEDRINEIKNIIRSKIKELKK